MNEHTQTSERNDGPPQVRRSRSALLFLSMLDKRLPCGCELACGDNGRCAQGEPRDRMYGHRFRYGLRTSATSGRVDRLDPGRSLY